MEPRDNLSMRWLSFLMVMCLPLWPQSRKPVFEAASVKRSAPNSVPVGFIDSPAFNNVRLQGRDHGRYISYGSSLRLYLQQAYRLSGDRISGPAWMDTDRYDIDARMPADTPDEQVLLMLQNLLAERFQLKFHHQQRETAVYGLIVEKHRPKLKPSVEGTPPTVQMGPMAMFAHNRSMRDLASLLGRWTDRPVIDLTEMSGHYDFELKWSGPAAADPGGPIASLQSLGLKIEARKMILDYLVIDSALKTPIAN
jgi:uncharacterized protein (TIGR03435 family)